MIFQLVLVLSLAIIIIIICGMLVKIIGLDMNGMLLTLGSQQKMKYKIQIFQSLSGLMVLVGIMKMMVFSKHLMLYLRSFLTLTKWLGT